MRIILQREVDKLGAPGDVVTVADGYARNYLIPKGLAAPATKGAERNAQRLKDAHGKRVRAAVDAANAVAEKLTARALRIPAKAGDDGRLFGSITVQQLADELSRVAEQPIDRRDVHLDEPIRSVGTHEVRVHLHPEVNAAVSVQVVAQ